MFFGVLFEHEALAAADSKSCVSDGQGTIVFAVSVALSLEKEERC